MTRLNLSKGIGRSTHLLLTIAATAVLVFSSCSSTSSAGGAVSWSDDPCGLAPRQEVATAFGMAPTRVGNTPPGECRYQLDETLLRIIVISDGNHCPGVEREIAARGATLISTDAHPGVVFVSDPDGDVVVCDSLVTYVLRAPGSTESLLNLASTVPSERSD